MVVHVRVLYRMEPLRPVVDGVILEILLEETLTPGGLNGEFVPSLKEAQVDNEKMAHSLQH